MEYKIIKANIILNKVYHIDILKLNGSENIDFIETNISFKELDLSEFKGKEIIFF